MYLQDSLKLNLNIYELQLGVLLQTCDKNTLNVLK